MPKMAMGMKIGGNAGVGIRNRLVKIKPRLKARMHAIERTMVNSSCITLAINLFLMPSACIIL